MRELHQAERDYLETPFQGADSGRPYVKTRFGSRDGWGSLAGFCPRSKVPRKVPIAAAPAEDPNPPMTVEQHLEWLKQKTGQTPIQMPDGSIVIEGPGKRRRE